MTDFDPSNPADDSIVSQFPSNERDSRAALTSAIAVEHDQVEGRHSFEVGNTAARDAITTWTSGALFVNSSAGPGNFVLQAVSSATASVITWEDTGRFTSANSETLSAISVVATSAEASAGTETALRAWSPVIVKTAVKTNAATQAQMEATAVTSTYATPENTQFHPGVAKAWCVFDGTAAGPITPDADYNVTNVTDNGTGDFTINFTNSFSGVNYTYNLSGKATGTVAEDKGIVISRKSGGTKTAAALQIVCVRLDGNSIETDDIDVAVFGDQ